MYHSISDSVQTALAPYYRTSTQPETFLRQMRALKTKGWRGVTLREGLSWLCGNTDDRNLFVLTFDDGFEDFYTAACPILFECGFTASMYVATAFIGAKFKDRLCMNWRQIRELHCLGMEFGSHTANHPKLWNLGWDNISTELLDSKRKIEDEIGAETPSFAYPYAFPRQDRKFVDTFRNELKTAGYKNCVTTSIGRVVPNDDLFTLKRLPANDCDDEKLLQAKIDGAYDWLDWPQLVSKRWKQRTRN